MLYNILKLAHVLAVILWVGGMLFAHCFLRPVAAQLQPATRLALLAGVLGRFLNAVLVAIIVILLTGAWMIIEEAHEAAQTGGVFFMPPNWIIMAAGGLIMMALFGHIRFVLYSRLRRAVTAADWPAGGRAMGGIRLWVAINLVLGLIVVAVVFLVPG